MKTAIMQAYFLPYIGYFQLIQSVDCFIVYDNIEYTKKGWINRNRFLQNGKDALFTLPLKKDSDFLDIKDRFIAADFKKDKLLNQLREAYQKAPYFAEVFPVIGGIFLKQEENLFLFILNSIKEICGYLGVDTKILVSSQIPIDHSLQSQDKVIALCKHLGAAEYINPIGGQELYSRESFKEHGLALKFLKTKPLEYKQFAGDFVPSLSILDVMMFNSKERIREYLTSYFDLV